MLKKLPLIVLPLIILFSFLLNSYNINFPLNYHADEKKKVFFVKEGEQDFKHPILMLQVVRLFNIPLKLISKQDIVVLGRLSSAVFGSLIAFIFYFISRLKLSRKCSLLVSLGIIVSPIMVMHSHYFKEDIIFTFFALCSLFCFFKYLKSKNYLSILLLGITTGLAFSSHYKSLLFIPVYLTAPFLVSKSIKINKRLFFELLTAFIIAVIVFLAVNYPLIFHFENFIKGFSLELNHVFRGHSLKRYPIDDFFIFHLKNSVVLGVTMPVAILGILFIFYSLLKWRKTVWQDRILILYCFVYYFAVELSLCKPFPDYMRYVIPFVPVLIYFAFKAIFLINASLSFYEKKYLTLFLVIALVSVPLIKTVKLDYYLEKDTRKTVKEYFKNSPYNPLYGAYAAENRDIDVAVNKSIEEYRQSNITHLVVSSFRYERYSIGSKLKKQENKVHRRHKGYVELFKYPYIEIKPAYKSFAFSNPTIRIIDIRNNSKKDTKK